VPHHHLQPSPKSETLATIQTLNGGGFATSATTTMEEARVTEKARSTMHRWWRDETAATWKKEPLRSAIMAFGNGRKKNGRCSMRRRRTVAQFLLNPKKAYCLN